MTSKPTSRPNDPRKVDDGPARQVIVRGEGVTDSERYLAKLADQSFLNLWCYPNVFIDKKSGGKGDGKELCDLLVVCGDHVLIFSDKTVAWPGGDDVGLAWRRWYKRAIQKSVDQIRGAERWMSQYPDRLFIDRKCSQPLPFPLPPPERRKVHGIVVANGAAAACRSHFGEGSGSLMIAPSIQGAAHYKGGEIKVFAVGDVDPTGSFVHTFDEATLDVVLCELDTISHLTAYLAKKEGLIRSGRLQIAAGEEELVAQFMIHMNAQGEHDFTKPDGTAWGENDRVTFGSGHYAALTKNPQYNAKKIADKVSYCWDHLITLFTDNMLAGTSVVPDGHSAEISNRELAVRQMALLPRFVRRSYGAGVLDALEEGQKADKFMRAFIPGQDQPHADTGFFFLTAKIPDIELTVGYQQYRMVRVNILEAYALTLLQKNPQIRRVVGIASEPKPPAGKKPGSSEDLIYAEQPEWTDQLVADLDERKKHFGIDQPGNARVSAISDREFPEVQSALGPAEMRPAMNRGERRAMEAERRRRQRKRR